MAEKVFLVDDDADVRDAVSMLLSTADHKVEVFEPGQALLDRVTPEDAGCMVLDVRLPGMDGLELQRALYRQGIRMPVVFITGHGDIPMAVRAVNAGALDFLEKPFDPETFLAKVDDCVKRYGHCTVVASEGAQYADGSFLASGEGKDAFGHVQLGGVAPTLAAMVKEGLGYKYHWALADYLQRSARHIASATDVEQAYAVGRAAVEFALEGRNAVMPIIRRLSDDPYRWDIDAVEVEQVASSEVHMPRDYITDDGFGITAAARRYLQPLIAGEAPPPYRNGLPDYVRLANKSVPKKLAPFKE